MGVRKALKFALGYKQVEGGGVLVTLLYAGAAAHDCNLWGEHTVISVGGLPMRFGRNSRLARPFFMALSRIADIRPDSARQSALAPVQAMAAPRAASTPVMLWW